MTIAGIPTRRPSPSRPDTDPDPIAELHELVGQVMGSQQAVSRAVDALRLEHETYTRTVVALHKDVTELLTLQQKHGRTMRQAAKVMPAILGVLELARYLLENFHH